MLRLIATSRSSGCRRSPWFRKAPVIHPAEGAVRGTGAETGFTGSRRLGVTGGMEMTDMNTRGALHPFGALLLAMVMLLWIGPLAAQTPVPAPLPNPDLYLGGGGVHTIAHKSDGGIVFGGAFSSVNRVARGNIGQRTSVNQAACSR